MNTRVLKPFSEAIVGLIAFALVAGCGKSQKESAEHEPQKFTQEQANQEFQKQLKVPGMRQTLDAGRFLAQLLESHRLPGAENAEKGAMLSPDSVYTPQPTNYPLTRTFNGQRKLGGPWENHYVVTKQSADTSWRLQRAWRTDTQGNTGEEYVVK